MLAWILDEFARASPEANWAGFVHGFEKITLRTALAAIASFLLAVALGPKAIRWLESHFRETLDDRSPQLRQLSAGKQSTPTMGGLFIVAGIFFSAILFSDWRNPYVPILVINLVGMSIVGAVDDLTKLRGGRRGIRARHKLAAQVAIAAVIAVWLYAVQRNVAGGLELQVPIVGAAVDLGYWFVPLTVLVVVGSSNAVNLTDGLDGLAGGCLITTTAALAAVTYIAGHSELADYIGVLYLPQAGETVVIAGAMLGAVLGFLWFNCQPAQVFMGDTGSLALGGTLGLLAVISRQELLLAIIGAVFVAEALSVIMQVVSFRSTGRRIFRCAPLHHHFQFLGWPENKIVARFWIVSALSAVIGLGILKLYPTNISPLPGEIEVTVEHFANPNEPLSVVR